MIRETGDIDRLLRQYRKRQIFDFESGTKINWARPEIEQIIPHREPFLLVDTVNRVNIEDKNIVGSRFLARQTPVFKGHFPDYPLYPGVLQLEMMGQLALCLHYFKSSGNLTPPDSPYPLNAKATRVIGAYYQTPLLPDSMVTILATELGESDEYFARMVGQVICDGEVCSVAAQEVCFG